MPLRMAVIGCGAIARRAHLPAFRAAGADRVDVVAFASRSRSSAEAAAEEWGSGRVHDSWQSLIDEAGVDAIDVCAPNRSHAEITVAALGAGKHVLVEKPMACTVLEADSMLAAAQRSGAVLSVAHNLRFAAPFYTAHRLVEAGAIGAVHGFRVAIGHSGPQTWAPEASWFFDPALSGGGALIDLGIHVADLLRFVLQDDVVEVSAVLSEPVSVGGVERSAQVLLRTRAGAVGSLHASWIVRPGPDHQLTLFGEEGTLHLDTGTPLTLIRPGVEKETVALEQPSTNPYAGFVDACLDGHAPPVPAQDGRAALAIIEAAYRSAATGRITRVGPRQTER